MSVNKNMLIAHVHQIIDIDNHVTKYITKKEVYIKFRLGQKTAKTQTISASGIVDEKITMPYENESVLECEIMVPSRPRVGFSQISLRQIPLQQNALPHGFRILNSARKQIATLGMTLFKTNRQAIAAQGTDILNATIGGNSRRASTTKHGGILSGFTANPISGQPAEGHVDPVQPEAALTTATQQSKALYRLQRTELKSIIGNVSDEKADELLGHFNGNVESAVNYFYATQQDSDSTVNQPPPPPYPSAPVAPTAPALLPTSNNNRNKSGINNTVMQSRRNSSNSTTSVRQRALSVQKFPIALHNQLRTIIGDVSDRKADELLDKAGGDVERAVNFYFANPESTVVPAASAVATASRRRSSTSRNLVVQPNNNTNSVATASRRRSSTSRNLVVQPHTNTNSVATASRRRPSASQNVVVQPNTNKKFIPVVRGSYINYNSAGTTFNNPNVVVQSRPVVVPSAPVTAHINNGYNPLTRNTMNQHAYGNYGSKCAPSKSSQISCHGKLN